MKMDGPTEQNFDNLAHLLLDFIEDSTPDNDIARYENVCNLLCHMRPIVEWLEKMQLLLVMDIVKSIGVHTLSAGILAVQEEMEQDMREGEELDDGTQHSPK